MPLSMANLGNSYTIIKVKGKDEQRKHLATLGFVEGAIVSVVTETAGNLILNIKDSRIALDKAVANRIMIN